MSAKTPSDSATSATSPMTSMTSMTSMIDPPPLGGQVVGAFLDALAAKQPVPGGGAAAGLVLATAASLGSMVLRYSVEKPAFASHRGELESILAELDRMRVESLAAADADARAYAGLQSVWKLPKEDPARAASIRSAAEKAIEAPRSVMTLASRLLDLAETLPDRTAKSLASDLAIAALLADAGFRAAAANVRINLPLLGDAPHAAAESARLDADLAAFRRRAEAIEARVR